MKKFMVRLGWIVFGVVQAVVGLAAWWLLSQLL